jgi:uncharacterized membrane protein
MSATNLDRRVGLALSAATVLSVLLLGLAVAAMIAGGVQPLTDSWPEFDPKRLGSDLEAGRADGWLWLGLIAVILTPVIRVAASLLSFAAVRDGRQAAIALTVLAIMLLSVVFGYGG